MEPVTSDPRNIAAVLISSDNYCNSLTNVFYLQRFYMCHEHGRSGRFSCPAGTLFSDKLGVCDWARRVRCV